MKHETMNRVKAKTDNSKRVCLVTTLHISYNPRLVKEADALTEAGYDVRVVAVNREPAKWKLDQLLMTDRRWRLDALAAQRRGRGRFTWLHSTLRQQLRLRWSFLRANRAGRELALSRYLSGVTKLARRERADLYVAHSVEAMPAAVAAARRWRAKAGVDFEDLYSGMHPLNQPPDLRQKLVEAVEADCVRDMAHLTAASPGVADAVARIHRCPRPAPVMNVFPLTYRPATRPPARPDGPLRAYWFSQVIGHDRGLANAIRAVGLLPRGSVELHLRGSCDAERERRVRALAEECNVPREQLILHAPERPERMVTLAAEYDVGLALEEPVTANRIICMDDLCTNKVFTYLLAGVALAATSAGEEREVYEGAGFVYPYARVEALAAGWRRWLDDRVALQRAKDIAWRLGTERYNWETEKPNLVAAVGASLGGH